jgi:cobalamin biosynthetic protein CobC
LTAAEAVAHGGDLGAARLLFPGAPEPFVDLSTGINPYPYPVPPLASELFTRLPEAAALERVAGAAAEAYGAASVDQVVVAPGTQIFLSLTAGLVQPGRAAVLSPTYAEHVRAAALAGHRVAETSDLAHLRGAVLAVVVNPNNPDGRLTDRSALLALAEDLSPGGLLVVDEAFMDVCPEAQGVSLAPYVGRGNIVVLRSFGKFYGLAGIRLGFALAPPELAERLRAMLGPWVVSGPALAVGFAALQDRSWAAMTRTKLAEAARRLDQILLGAGLEVVGGTSLFRFVETPAAPGWFDRLGRAGILVRRFSEHAARLRFGLPGQESDWERLAAALQRERSFG